MPSDSSESHTANQLQSRVLACLAPARLLSIPRGRSDTAGAAKGVRSRRSRSALGDPGIQGDPLLGGRGSGWWGTLASA